MTKKRKTVLRGISKRRKSRKKVRERDEEDIVGLPASPSPFHPLELPLFHAHHVPQFFSFSSLVPVFVATTLELASVT
jgi:hypothetical protein